MAYIAVEILGTHRQRLGRLKNETNNNKPQWINGLPLLILQQQHQGFVAADVNASAPLYIASES
jgi:hypothetical protein